MASILVDRLVGRRPCHLPSPRPVPRVRIFHREAIEKRFVVNAPQALDDVQILGRSTKPRFAREIGRVDDERFPFPLTHRIPHPAADILGKMLRIHPDDARVVNHFAEDHNRVWSLHDLMQIVIEIVRQCRRAGGGAEA